MNNKLVVGYVYSKLLNLYGDNGNIEVLGYRAKKRGFDVEIKEIDIDTRMSDPSLSEINFLFMGGGPDSAQKNVYQDLLESKKGFITNYINGNGVGLFVCGSYQLLGKYYKASDGAMLEGVGIFDLYTENFGSKRPRCIGNTVARLSNGILNDPVFIHVNNVGKDIVGFENHGGRTFLSNKSSAFCRVLTGHGNNSEDGTEGFVYKNSIGTYFHGPILARNPHFADYLLAKSLGLSELPPIDDTVIVSAFSASKKLRQ